MVFLRSIELFGFKSFPERTRIEFASGVSAILGPNGCGKSNIVDAVKWVLGEQSHKSLRADSMEDVIFNGTETRKPLNWCEVILTLSNENGVLDLDLPEITVGRRLFRNGESEYTINKVAVKLKDVRDLFMDTGVGKSAYSIMEQGRIDQILSNKPEERRYIFEEAAGITRFKSRSLEAERKLSLTEENLKQIEGILGEVRRNFETLKAQAAKTEKYRNLRQEIFDLEKRIAQNKLSSLSERQMQVQQRLSQLEEKRQNLKTQLNQITQDVGEGLAGVEQGEEELKSLQRRIHELELKRSQLHTQESVLKERERALNEQIQNLQVQIQRFSAESEQFDHLKNKVSEEIRIIEQDLQKDRENIRVLQERLSSQQESITQYNQEEMRLAKLETELQEEVKKATEVLAELTNKLVEVIDQQVAADPELWNSLQSWLSELHQEVQLLVRITHHKKSFAQDLGDSSQNSIKADWLLQQWQEVENIVDSIQLKFERFFSTVPSLLGELFSPHGSLWQKRNQDQNIQDLHQQLSQKRDQRLEVIALRQKAEEQVRQLQKTLEELKINQARQESILRSKKEEFQRLIFQQEQVQKNFNSARQKLLEFENQQREFQQQSQKILEEQKGLKSKEEDLRLKQDAIRLRIQAESRSLANKEGQQKKLFQELNLIQEQIEKLSKDQGEVHAEIRSLQESFRERHGLTLNFEPEQTQDDIAQLKDRMAQLKEEQKSLGQVNLMAPEEFKEVSQRYEFLVQQIDDLKKAREDLKTIVAEIQREASKLFVESFKEIQKNFHDIFRRLFGGGRAELRLTNEQNALESGVELFCQPPGKKLESLSLLSGGEKSLTAVALLFAVYMVRPSPFCILDEIDAALDESNVGRFITMLQEFSATSQFIMITHNKRTVIGCSTLIGITMEESGVSKILTIRLGNQEREGA